MTDALDAVIDTALERALLADDARRYFALAGALERGRSAARTDGAGIPQPEYRGPGDDRSEPSGGSTDVLGAALLSMVAVDALESAETEAIDPDAWLPGGRDGGPHAELVAAGAAAACRRFEVDPGTIAAWSGLPLEQLARYRIDSDATTGPK